MKVAFHFDADDSSLGGFYGHPIRKALFGIALTSRTLDLNTKIFEGDLLLSMFCMDTETVEGGEIRRPNQNRYFDALETLLHSEKFIWGTVDELGVKKFKEHNVHICLFESISFKDAIEIDKSLKEFDFYIGALQVDDTNPIHWVSYSGALVCSFRLMGKSINCFWDGDLEDSKDEGLIEDLKEIGFRKVDFESLNGKFSIFDEYHDFEQARRVAELTDGLSDALSFLADQTINRLSDAAPELGNKFWSILRAYDRAEVNEDYAQVAASCRRVIEYVTDKLFPAQNEKVDGRKVEAPHYKNRILAYADAARKSDTNIDLICVNMDVLSRQVDKLLDLVNKGVHSEVFKHEVRRCLIRTITTLDDIVSLKNEPLKIDVNIE